MIRSHKVRTQLRRVVPIILLSFVAWLPVGSQADEKATSKSSTANTLRGEKIHIAPFSQGKLSDWNEKEFEGQTRYRLVEVEGNTVLSAHSKAAASGLFIEQTIDLRKTPFINWCWRIDQHLPVRDETIKQNDDYAARLYVVVDGGFFFWKTKALNYVWSSRSEVAAPWPNAFAPDNARMLALRSRQDEAGQWYCEKRNVRKDLEEWLGKPVEEIHAVAIMTDTDNAGDQAQAYYGDISFSAN